MSRCQWMVALVTCAALVSAVAGAARVEAQAPVGGSSDVASTVGPAEQKATPVKPTVHPTFCRSEEQLRSWVEAGYKAFASGKAYDDGFSVPGVSQWYWLPSEVTLIGDAGAVVGISCETPQLLATYTAWRGTRSALPEAQAVDAINSQLAQQAGYCRFVVVGLTRSGAEDFGLEYVLRVNGTRYGQPRVSSPYDQPLSAAQSLLDRRDYRYLSVLMAERFDVEYSVDVQGKTYTRTQARASVGYERQASVVQIRPVTWYTQLVTEIVDFPLVRDDGAPLIAADASVITLEMLAPDASYEVNVNLTTGFFRPRLGYQVLETKLRQTIEEITKRPEYADWVLRVSQADPKVPTISMSVEDGWAPSAIRRALKAIVIEGQKVCEDGNLVIILDVRGRKTFEARYRPESESVLVTSAQ